MHHPLPPDRHGMFHVPDCPCQCEGGHEQGCPCSCDPHDPQNTPRYVIDTCALCVFERRDGMDDVYRCTQGPLLPGATYREIRVHSDEPGDYTTRHVR